MKTLIIYGSTYGYAKDCANQLSEQLKGEVVVVNALKDTVPSLSQFDNVVIGGSIYMGRIQKKIKEYCASNESELIKKRLGLFVCCGLTEGLEQYFKSSFPEKLINSAITKECFGGELREDKMKLVHKMITNMMKKVAAKEGKPPSNKMPENISKLAMKIES